MGWFLEQDLIAYPILALRGTCLPGTIDREIMAPFDDTYH